MVGCRRSERNFKMFMITLEDYLVNRQIKEVSALVAKNENHSCRLYEENFTDLVATPKQKIDRLIRTFNLVLAFAHRILQITAKHGGQFTFLPYNDFTPTPYNTSFLADVRIEDVRNVILEHFDPVAGIFQNRVFVGPIDSTFRNDWVFVAKYVNELVQRQMNLRRLAINFKD